jgi:hypothetical protein
MRRNNRIRVLQSRNLQDEPGSARRARTHWHHDNHHDDDCRQSRCHGAAPAGHTQAMIMIDSDHDSESLSDPAGAVGPLSDTKLASEGHRDRAAAPGPGAHDGRRGNRDIMIV